MVKEDEGPAVLDDSARLLRALAHPLRLKLAQVMSGGTARNVSDLADAVGEAANSVSFHVRQLARYGLVEKVDGPPGSTRKESWWRLVPQARDLRVNSDAWDDADRESQLANLHLVLAQQALDRVDGLLRCAEEKGSLASHQEYSVELTDDEARDILGRLAAIGEELRDRQRQRSAQQVPADARRWLFVVEGFPETRPGR